MVQLSEGALTKIMQGENVEDLILQYMGHRKLNNAERYRLLVNDGKEVSSFAMLSPLLNHLIKNKTLINYSVIKVTKKATTTVDKDGQQKRVIVILDLEVLISGLEVGQPIGEVATQIFRQFEPEQSPQQNPPAPPVPPVSVTYNNRRNNNMNNNNVSHPPVILGTNRMLIVDDPLGSITPLAALTPYSNNNWVIKVRVSSKTEKKSWSKPGSQGVFFNMELMDQSGKIKCIAFNESCEKYFDMVKLGSVYYISKATLKQSTYSNLKNIFEMSLRRDTMVLPCHDGTDVPQVRYNFTPIKDIEQMVPSATIDILGIVQSVDNVIHFVSKNSGKPYTKRDINLVDNSDYMVTLTLWGQQAVNFSANDSSVLMAKDLKVSEYMGNKSLGSINQSVLLIDPDTPEAHAIRGWYSTVGVNASFKNISRDGSNASIPWLSIAEAIILRYGQPDQPNVYMLKATVDFIRRDSGLYKACPIDNCFKKVNENANGMFQCDKCNREYPNFRWRIIAAVNLSDWSGNLWVTAFNDQAEVLIGATADELGTWQENDREKYLEKLDEAGLKTYIFKLRVKTETFRDESKLKTSIVEVKAVDLKISCDQQLKKIRQNMRALEA